MPYKDKAAQKAAQARYYQENKKRIVEAQNSKRALWRRYVADIKSQTPCMDCGLQYPHYVMDFDHRPDEVKSFNIGHAPEIPSMDALQKEIDKCDVVCSNCHRHRTFMRLDKVESQDD